MDILDKIREFAENGRKDQFKTKIVWEIVEKDDKVLLFLPNIRNYFHIENSYILQVFRETIQTILSRQPRYVVVYIEENLFTDEFLKKYEAFYGVELQWISDIDVFENELFMEHHHYKKVYIVKKTFDQMNISKEVYTKVIVDTIYLPHQILFSLKEKDMSLHYGKCFMQEVVNVKFYLNKFMNHFQPTFRPGQTQITDREYDIALVIGKTVIPYHIIMDLIYNAIKKNQCSMIFSCNERISKEMTRIKKELKVSFPMIDYSHEILDTDVIHDLSGRFHRISKKYCTYIFIGAFDFDIKHTRDIWNKYIEEIEEISIFDPEAYNSLLTHIPSNKTDKFRVSTDIMNMLDMFFKDNTDPLHTVPLDENEIYDEEEYEEDYDEEYDEEDPEEENTEEED